MYGNFEVYLRYCTACLKIDYTLRCLEYICSNREDTYKCTPLRKLCHTWQKCYHMCNFDVIFSGCFSPPHCPKLHQWLNLSSR